MLENMLKVYLNKTSQLYKYSKQVLFKVGRDAVKTTKLSARLSRKYSTVKLR